MSLTERKHHVYVLLDPRNGDVKYVGFSARLTARFAAHCRDTDRNRKAHWIRSLARMRLRPQLMIIGTFDSAEQAKRAEVFAIARLRERGADLTNTTDGGDGLTNPSPEVREKIGSKHRGRVLSQRHRARVAAGLKRHFAALPPGKRSRHLVGRPVSPATREKLRASVAASWQAMSKEQRDARMKPLKDTAATMQRQPCREETKAALSKIVKGHWSDPTVRAARVAAFKAAAERRTR